MKPCEACGKPDEGDQDDCAYCHKTLCPRCMEYATCTDRESPDGFHRSEEEFD